MNEFCTLQTILQSLHVLPCVLTDLVCHYALKTGHQRLLAMLKANGYTLCISHPTNRDSMTLIFNNRNTIMMQIIMYGIHQPNYTIPTAKLARMLQNKSWLKNADVLWTILHNQWMAFSTIA